MKSAVLAGMLLLCSQGRVFCAHEELVQTTKAVNSDGTYTFTVTNKSKAALTGMTVRVDRFPPSVSSGVVIRIFYDYFLHPNDIALQNDQSHSFIFGGDAGDASPISISLEAAIFEDGLATGERSAIKSIWDSRHWLATGYDEVVQHINDGEADIRNRDEVVKMLVAIKKVRIGPNTPLDERDSVGAAYETAIRNLRDNLSRPPEEIINAFRKKAAATSKGIKSQFAPIEAVN
jgi:hypothetical protein